MDAGAGPHTNRQLARTAPQGALRGPQRAARPAEHRVCAQLRRSGVMVAVDSSTQGSSGYYVTHGMQLVMATQVEGEGWSVTPVE